MIEKGDLPKEESHSIPHITSARAQRFQIGLVRKTASNVSGKTIFTQAAIRVYPQTDRQTTLNVILVFPQFRFRSFKTSRSRAPPWGGGRQVYEYIHPASAFRCGDDDRAT